MKYTPAATGFPGGIPAWKRRYSSTAVGFPIRNDQKPHSHGLSDGFPSWERARRTHTYVHTRKKNAQSPENHQPYCQALTMIVPNNDTTSTRKYPLWRCTKIRQTLICTSFAPRLLPVCFSFVPCVRLVCTSYCAAVFLICTSLAPRLLPVCTSIVPCLHLALCSDDSNLHLTCTTTATQDYPTNNQQPHYEHPTTTWPTRHVSLGVRLRFTWESLAAVRNSFTIRSSHISG